MRASGSPGSAVAGSELRLRLLSAAVLVPLTLWACYAGGIAYVAGVSVVAGIGIEEFHGLLRAQGVAAQRALGLLGAVLLPWVVYAGDAQLALAFGTALLLGSLIYPLVSGPLQGALASAAGTCFGIGYVGGLLGFAVALRFAGERGGLAGAGIDPRAGLFFTVFALTCAVGSDVGGFFAGRRFGRRKLAPRISPGKTVEGGLGAIAAGSALGLAAWALFHAAGASLTGGLPWTAAAVAAPLLAAVAVVGDLIESLLKRDSGVKDAGHIVPGVGGVLDRIDSALLTLPVMYYALLGYYAWLGP